MTNKCVFLDRDGVLNVDRVDYVYHLGHFVIPDGVVEAFRGDETAKKPHI